MPLLTPDHFKMSQNVRNFCDAFFKQHQVNYFQFSRQYKDGSAIALLSNTAWLEWWAENEMPTLSTIDKTLIKDHHYSFLWDPNLPKYATTAVANLFDITNGLCFVFRYQDYYELISFGVPSHKKNAVDYYLNHYETFQKFILYFRTHAKDLISEAEHNKIHLPTKMQDQNKDILCRSSNLYLTPQELQCLQLLSYGNSIKEIGQELDLSPRTVETYFNRTKVRFNITSNKELINLVR